MALLLSAAMSGAARAESAITEYKRLCEASTGVYVDNKHFVVVSDESNTFRLYERGKPEPVGSVNLRKFIGFKKSDIEASAKIGDRIYWLSSHSRKKDGSEDAKRRVFFATKIGSTNGLPILTGEGRVVKDLLSGIIAAAGVNEADLDIEAMAATPDGRLLIGLRKPPREEKTTDGINKKNAIVIVLANPAGVIAQNSPESPKFSGSLTLDLDGRGLRSMELISDNPPRYLIVAGPARDAAGFALYQWDGPGNDPQSGNGSQPVELKNLSDAITGLFPEAAMVVPGTNTVQILSDEGDAIIDGKECSDDDDDGPPIEKRRFKSVDLTP